MPIDYHKIAEENIKKYGTDIDRYGPVLLANLYSDRTHFIYELLQNVEDACDRAKKTGVRNEFYVKFKLFPDRLEMRHDGILFDENDVRGICGLVEGTKEKDLTQIGKFGIGFKSVYAYTSKPRIYSGDEAFCVENYVQPRGRKKVNIKHNETLFIFPFNHRKVSPDQAFKDISKRLRELGSRTLLFLNNIGEINWTIIGEESGAYIRDAKFISEYSKKIYIISKSGEQEDKGEEWLVFERPVNPESTNVSNLKVEVAFRIGRKKKDKRETIIPADNSHLVVFFPTEKETHLMFLIQGPFITTTARDNIPKEDEWNINLIKETAALAADSIPIIKEMGFLTVDFLNVLPISEDHFPEDHMFRPIYDAVLKKLKSSEKLLPANDSSYINADQAFLVGGRGLIDLLGTEQLVLLFGKQDTCWLDSNITQDKTPELMEYFIEKLDITEITPEKVAREFTEEFVKKQSDEWIIKFYMFLKERKPLWRKGSNTYWDREGLLRSKPFIRLEDNIHVAPFDDSGKPQAYLPTLTDSSFPTAKRKIAEDVQAREFLKDLGLTEPDKFAEIIEFILPKYQKDDVKVSEKDNLDDVRKILDALDTDSEKSNLMERLKNTPFLLTHNFTNDELFYRKPSEIYLPETITGNSDLEIYFEGSPDVYLLDDTYKKLSKKQLLESICLVRPRIINDKYYVWQDYTKGFTHDYKMDGLEFCVKNNLCGKNSSKYIWDLLLLSQRDNSYKIEFKGILEYANDYKFCGKNVGEEEKITDVYKVLSENEWLPDENGVFHKPCKILLSELPADFEKESLEAKSLAEKLEFKKDIEQELLSRVSPEKREIYELVNSSSEEDIQAIMSLLKERKKKSQFPEGKAPDKARREKKARENYVSSKKRKFEKRERLVRITQDQVDKRTSLREWYQDDEEKVVCQMCKSPSYFKNRQGKYYFEAIEMVKDEKEYDANALALCPLCAAKYLYGEKTEDTEIKQKLIKLYNDLNNGPLNQNELKITISLCSKTTDIQFVEKHLIDLSPIFDENQNDE